MQYIISKKSKESYLERVFGTALSEMIERRGRGWWWVIGWQMGVCFPLTSQLYVPLGPGYVSPPFAFTYI